MKSLDIITEELDLGADKIFENLEKLEREPFVKVGILEKSGNHRKKSKSHKLKKGQEGPEYKGAEITVADVATFHEYGGVTHRGNVSWDIPERSFIRSSMFEKEADLEEKTEKIFDKILEGELTVEKGLAVLGQEISKNFKNKIDSNIPPPLADSTIKAKTRDGKAGQVALVDTAQMRNAIAHEVVLDGSTDEGSE